MFPEAVRAAFGVLRIGIGILTKTPASSSAVTLKDYRRRLGDVSAWRGQARIDLAVARRHAWTSGAETMANRDRLC
jgi:hypothetical protein